MVYGTARSRDIERVRALGAEPVVEGDRSGAQLASRPLNAVIDTIGDDALESTWEALRPNGIIVSIVRPPDDAYLRSRSVRAAYFIVDVTRDRLAGSRRWSSAERLTCPSARFSTSQTRKSHTACWMARPTSPERSCSRSQTDRGGFNHGCGKVRCRRISPVPMGPGERPITEPTTAVKPPATAPARHDRRLLRSGPTPWQAA